MRRRSSARAIGGIDDLSNHEIVTLAVFLQAGASKAADTEDIAVCANQLAPGRFTWRKYPDQISLDAIRKRLWDAQSPARNFCYVTGSEGKGWMLTPKGLAFAHDHQNLLQSKGTRTVRMSRDEQRLQTREKSRISETAAAQKFASGHRDEITKAEAEEVFRLDTYITGKARQQKIHRLVNLLGDSDLGELVNFVALVSEDSDAGEATGSL